MKFLSSFKNKHNSPHFGFSVKCAFVRLLYAVNAAKFLLTVSVWRFVCRPLSSAFTFFSFSFVVIFCRVLFVCLFFCLAFLWRWTHTAQTEAGCEVANSGACLFTWPTSICVLWQWAGVTPLHLNDSGEFHVRVEAKPSVIFVGCTFGFLQQLCAKSYKKISVFIRAQTTRCLRPICQHVLEADLSRWGGSQVKAAVVIPLLNLNNWMNDWSCSRARPAWH